MVQALVMNIIGGIFVFGYVLKKTYDLRMKQAEYDAQLMEDM